MTEKDNLQLAHKALAAINAHDIEGYLKLIDDAYVAESETTGTIRGRDGARQAMTTMFTHALPPGNNQVLGLRLRLRQ